MVLLCGLMWSDVRSIGDLFLKMGVVNGVRSVDLPPRFGFAHYRLIALPYLENSCSLKLCMPVVRRPRICANHALTIHWKVEGTRKCALPVPAPVDTRLIDTEPCGSDPNARCALAGSTARSDDESDDIGKKPV